MARKHTLTTLGASLTMAALLAAPAAAQGNEVLVAFDPATGQLPEGLTVDADGNVYTAYTPLGQLVMVAAGSDAAEPFGAVEGLAEGDLGVLGMATDAEGNVLAAIFSSNPEVNGVWSFEAGSGAAERVAGTEAVAMPNSVILGPDGELYVTDTITGGVWVVPEGGTAEPWLVDPLLEGNGAAGFPFPIGANGIDVHDGAVYVGVTEQGSLVRVPIEADGSAGTPEVVAQMEGVVVDGITVDDEGTTYIADPIANDVVSVDAAGAWEFMGLEGLDGSTSVDLGVDAAGNPALYVANSSVFVGTELGAGPSITVHVLDS